jgi:UDP-N-acetylmuramoyl-tripeptide--D-alanyl-D-alanine ligase
MAWMKVFLKGMKLLVFRDTTYPEILVLEMGADKPGDIAYLVDIAPCSIGILTFISHAHTEFFSSLKKIAQEKRVIISELPMTGWAVLNYDNALVMEQRAATKAHVVTYGFKEGADVRASDIHLVYDSHSGWPMGINFKVSIQGHTIPLFIPSIAEHLIPAALAALTVAHIFELNVLEAAQALRQFKPLPGHMRLIPGIKKTMIIDDTYNSSPDAARSALQSLVQFHLKQQSSDSGFNEVDVELRTAPEWVESARDVAERYAVLGDMLELGEETINAHREIGFKVAELGVDYLIVVGEASKHTAAAAREAGMDEHRIAVFADSVAAGKFLQDKLREGDIVLVKGSQGVRMEKIVKEIMDNPLAAKDLLVRQEDEWQK